MVDEASEDEGEGAFDGIRAVSGKQASSSKAKVVDVEEDAANADESPLFTNPDMPNLGAVLEAADVVVEVLDARDPLAYRSSHLEEVVKAKAGQKLLLVLNKIGTLQYFCDRVRVISIRLCRCVSSGVCRFLGNFAQSGAPDSSVPVGLRFPSLLRACASAI